MRFGDKPLLEVTLRKYERPAGKPKEEVLKKFCMALGLLQPGDSRDQIVGILDVLLREKRPVTVGEISGKLGKKSALSGIRRHLRRLAELKLVEKQGRLYRLAEGEDLQFAVKFLTRKFVVEDILSRIEEYAAELKGLY